MHDPIQIEAKPWTGQQLRVLAEERVFFGHQSVGQNIVQGMRDLAAADPRLKLNIQHSADPAQVAGPAFIEAEVGENTKPGTKNEAFLAAIDEGFGAQGGVAMLKYCYVDIQASTDVNQMFDRYRALVSQTQAKYPSLTLVHVTAPLTTVEPSTMAWVKRVLGRTTMREENKKRNEYNALLRKAYAENTIFDLAEVESTRPDGSRSYFEDGAGTVYTLASEYTIDGGHLNATGRTAAARRLLEVLSALPEKQSAHSGSRVDRRVQ